MKPIFTRRTRHRSAASKDNGFFKKEHQPEQTFFGEGAPKAFFQPAAIQRKCEKCEEEDKKVQRKSDKEEEKKMPLPDMKKEEEKDKKLQKKESGAAATTSTLSASNALVAVQESGASLPPTLQQFFGERMHYDFSNVKVHTGALAHQSAKKLQAQAFTYNNHIVFGAGKFQPETEEGKRLLAHELTHVIQQQASPEQAVARKEEESATGERIWEEKELPDIFMEGLGSNQENKTAYGCAGVNVQGRTDANYSNSFSSNLTTRTARHCEGCEGDDCLTARGTLVSVFSANPTVTLPSVPSGLSECEEAAVRTFINTTLRQHELQHVAAFNTYNATIRTRINYTGCRDGLDAHMQNIHDGIEAQRRASSDAKSAALDPFNVTIPCDCE